MAEQPTADPRATFNAGLYADTYKFARATLRLTHDEAVAHAYNIAASAPKPDGLTVAFRNSDTTITNSDGTVPNV